MPSRLRIAVSVFFALVAVAFAVLWVRSYWWSDTLKIPLHGSSALVMASGYGKLWLANPATDLAWNFSAIPIGGVQSDFLQNLPYWGWTALGPGNYVFLLPHWICIAFTAALAIATWWLRWKFSLRTMLIATTLVAVVLGLGVWATRAPKSPPIDWVDDPAIPADR